jgi:threonine dehydrogenase-like Zn-dependent dehydrogenase
MKATLMYGAGDVRIEDVPDPAIHAPTDAVVRVMRAAICGSDLHPYRSMPATDQGRQMGHEFLGIVEDAGAEVTGFKRGDLVLSAFTYADNTCFWCRRGLQTSCPHGGRYGFDGVDGGQGEAVRTNGNPALSIRGDEAEEAWRVVAPVLSAWSKDLVPLLEYPAGSGGPGAAAGSSP